MAHQPMVRLQTEASPSNPRFVVIVGTFACFGVAAAGFGFYWAFYPSWTISSGDSHEFLRANLGAPDEVYSDSEAFRAKFNSDWHWHNVTIGQQVKARELPAPSGIALHYSRRIIPYLFYVEQGKVTGIYWMTAD